jgi:hypothetical protein
VIDELVGLEVVVDGVGLEDPLEVVEMRPVVMIVDPACLHKHSLDVVVFRVEDKDLLIADLASLLGLLLPCLLGKITFIADYIL